MPEYTPETFLDALRARRVRYLRRVRFKDNRYTLLSVSRDRSTLHAHRCYRHAPEDVLNAIATFLTVRRSAPEYRQALARIRSWPTVRTRSTGRSTFGKRPPRRREVPRPGPCAGTPAQRQFLWRVYARLNQSHFGGRLPVDVPLRLSSRMTRRFGQVSYYEHPCGVRVVIDLAINLDLMLEGNEAELYDTLLHEMAHIEAWLLHGDAGHGPVWRSIAERVGCEPAACSRRRFRRRPRWMKTLTRIPPIPTAA